MTSNKEANLKETEKTLSNTTQAVAKVISFATETYALHPKMVTATLQACVSMFGCLVHVCSATVLL